MGRGVRREPRTSSTGKYAPGGRAEEQVSPRLQRSAGEPGARTGTTTEMLGVEMGDPS